MTYSTIASNGYSSRGIHRREPPKQVIKKNMEDLIEYIPEIIPMIPRIPDNIKDVLCNNFIDSKRSRNHNENFELANINRRLEKSIEMMELENTKLMKRLEILETLQNSNY